jgi:hypothetical protein
MDYKAELYRLRLDRRDVAKKIGVSYSGLNARLSEFVSWQPGEEKKLVDIIRVADIERSEVIAEHIAEQAARRAAGI